MTAQPRFGNLVFTVALNEATAVDSTAVSLKGGTFESAIQFPGPGVLNLQSTLQVAHASVEESEANLNATARDFRVTLTGSEIRVDAEEPLHSQGTVDLNLRLGEVSGESGTDRFTLQGAGLQINLPLAGRAALSGSWALPIEKLVIRQGESDSVTAEGLSLSGSMKDITATIASRIGGGRLEPESVLLPDGEPSHRCGGNGCPTDRTVALVEFHGLETESSDSKRSL